MKFGKQDKGVAGLTILLSLITFLFVIGLLVMIFTLMGGELKDSDTVKASDTSAGFDTAVTSSDAGTTLTVCSGKPEAVVTSVTSVYNLSGDVLIASGNYTTSGCIITMSSTSAGDLSKFNETVWNVTYVYSFAGSSYGVMNDTITGISDVTDWYPIFVVIGAMVVLILLTVIIITAIRGSGLMIASEKGGNEGSA